MKTLHLKTLALMLGLFLFTSANAHDPSEHKENAEAPKCEAMGEMDHSKMDSNDPVMQAMMEKCKSSHIDKMNNKDMMGHHADNSESESGHDDKMKEKDMMNHHADDKTQADTKSTEENADDSHSDDHD